MLNVNENTKKALDAYAKWAGEGWQENLIMVDWMRAGSDFPRYLGEYSLLHVLRNTKNGREFVLTYEPREVK